MAKDRYVFLSLRIQHIDEARSVDAGDFMQVQSSMSKITCLRYAAV